MVKFAGDKMVKVPATEVSIKFDEWIEYVRKNDDAVVVTGSDGDLVKIIPIPKPVSEWHGKPVYKLKDVQFLDFPYW